MEQRGQVSMNLVFEINDCTLYDTSNGKLKLLNMGVLAIYELRSQNLIVLKLGDWQYSLSKNVPVMAQQQAKRKMYAFPKQGGTFGLLLGPHTSDEQQCCLESIFYQNSEYVEAAPQDAKQQQCQPNQQQQQQQQPQQQQKSSSWFSSFTSSSSSSSQQQPQQQSGEKVSTSKKVQGFLSMGGDFIRSGLITGAGYVAQGIQSGGSYIKSKITKPTHKEVKPETLAKVKMAKATSSAVLMFTQAQVSALISGAKVVGSEIGNQIASSETGQKFQQHKNYDDVKNVAKGTVHAVAAIYDGMYEGLCTIGRGFQGATTEVVQQKYGEGAGQLAHESFETVGNVGNMTRAFQTETVKAMHDGTQSQVYRQ